jgi:hypothetical protein
MSQYKLNATKECICALLDSSGSQSFESIYQEVKAQAWLGSLPKAICELMADGSIVYDDEEKVYE